MAKICYVPKTFSAPKLAQIVVANNIINSYHSQGYDLTVRQLYYQFVARGHIPNQPEEYSKLQGLLNDARLAGLIDWDAIVDRTRNLRALHHYSHPRDPIGEASESFRFWKWEKQPHYVEVWVEKDALLSIVGQMANKYDVPYFSCRGYTSVSEVHSAAMRFQYEQEEGKTCHVIHLGDHDPSGIDMTRDIKERITQVFRVPVQVHRVALTREQIDRYNPPPNPAKLTDSRVGKYMEQHGEYSWELDALEPSVLSDIIEVNIRHWLDMRLWEQSLKKEQKARNMLRGIYDDWNNVYKFVQRERNED